MTDPSETRTLRASFDPLVRPYMMLHVALILLSSIVDAHRLRSESLVRRERLRRRAFGPAAATTTDGDAQLQALLAIRARLDEIADLLRTRGFHDDR